jgi:small subunit ribosomal protein S16
MSVKIRLQRRGRKKKPHYNIVVADSAKPRDGRSIQKLGYYNPNSQPATIELNNDNALYWLQVGAQPTPTVDRILSYRGVKYRKHLLRGVKKGILTEEEADEKYAKWLEDKAAEIQKKVEAVQQKSQEEAQQRLEAEAAINRQRAEALKAKESEEGSTDAETAAQPAESDQEATEEAGEESGDAASNEESDKQE